MKSRTEISKPGLLSSNCYFHTYDLCLDKLFPLFGPFVAFTHKMMVNKTTLKKNLLHSSRKAAEALSGCSGIRCEQLFKSRHMFWIGLRSGLWLGLSRTIGLLFLNISVELLLHACGCLLAGKSIFFSGGSPPAEWVGWSSRIWWYSGGSPAEKHLQSSMLPPSCFTWRWCVCDDVQSLPSPNII